MVTNYTPKTLDFKKLAIIDAFEMTFDDNAFVMAWWSLFVHKLVTTKSLMVVTYLGLSHCIIDKSWWAPWLH